MRARLFLMGFGLSTALTIGAGMSGLRAEENQAADAQLAQAQTRPAAPAPVATPPQPPLRTFQNAELATAAERLLRRLQKDGAKDQRPIPDLRKDADAATQKQDFSAAANLWRDIALRSGPDSAPWWRYGQALIAIKSDDYSERARLNDDGQAAAYLAYQRAQNRTEEALALGLVGRIFQSRSSWRPAIDAYKAALNSRDNPDLRRVYEELREKRGFRIEGFTVDSDALSPRACFQFSESLRKGFDYAPYIAQEGVSNPPITVEDQQICVDGLKHGQNYAFVVREGLPAVASIGESLLKAAEYSTYVRDRKPNVRAAGKTYVLPRAGQHGIPLTSTNVARLGIRIHRIGDRGLVNAVATEFPSPPLGWYADQLTQTQMMPVWSGTLDVAQQTNQDVVTAFPIGEAVKDLAPGLYLLTASTSTAERKASSEGDDDGAMSATQWFIVSDLGLATANGTDGLTVFIHNLGDARPRREVEVRVLARNNEVLAIRKTDGSGLARIEAGLMRGTGGLEPALLVAQSDGDYAFLNLKQPAFDLSDRGVSGRAAPGPVDAFVTPERGVYRSGETVNITALMRNGRAEAVSGLPLTLVVQRPDGQEYRRLVTPDQGLGGRSVAVPLITSAPTGTWRVLAYTDPKLPAIGSATFIVEDYLPERIEFKLQSPMAIASRGGALPLTLDGRYLFGAPAADLEVEGEIAVGLAYGLPGFSDYRFGLGDETLETRREALPDGLKTDGRGHLTFAARLPRLPQTTRLLAATITARISEPGGRAVERSLVVPVAPQGDLIGIKPGFTDDRASEGQPASFEVIAIGADGQRKALQGLKWQLLKVETRYQWYRANGGWDSEAVQKTTRVADGLLDAGLDQPARLNLPVEWGRYRLDIQAAGADGPTTSYGFQAGWGGGGSADTPDVLDMALDKPGYASGDTMTIAIKPRFAGVATVAIIGERVISTQVVDVPADGTKVTLPVGADWGAGAYAVVFHRRPLDIAAARQPGRAIGLAWFSVDRETRTLPVTLTLPERTTPQQTVSVPVKISGLRPGEEARVTLAAVDVGILNLTGFKAPQPEQHYFGKRTLGVEFRDLYGQLIDGMQGVRGAIRSGGDALPPRFMGSPPAQEPVALFSGVVTPGADGTAEVRFDLPDFNGTLRVMAMAWTANRVGSASRDLVVRNPVVVNATLPRFLAIGDVASARFDLTNTDAPAGAYALSLNGEAPLSGADLGGRNVQLAAGGRQSVTVPLSASAAGLGALNLRLSGGTLALNSRYRLGVRAPYPVQAQRELVMLKPGENVSLAADRLRGLVSQTARLTVSASVSSALDVPALIGSLDRYPYGCTEQSVSRALPLLYLSELSLQERELALSEAGDKRLQQTIDRVLARQGGAGGFGLWNSEQTDDIWITAYATDFLLRARDKGLAVPAAGISRALDSLRNAVTNASDPLGDNGGTDVAYAHYVLARAGMGQISDLRFLVDTKLNDVTTALARGQMGAALAMLGDMGRAERVFASAIAKMAERPDDQRRDYGSALRDAAAIMTLAQEARLPRNVWQPALQQIESERKRVAQLSTQEKVWLVLAARAVQQDNAAIRLDVGGASHSGALSRVFAPDQLATPVTISNRGSQPIEIALTMSGAPQQAPAAAANDFTVSRDYFALDGKPANPARVAQGTRLVVVLKARETDAKASDVMLVDHLPAGFEIDNPALVKSGDANKLPWLEALEGNLEPVHSEFRDDRFTAAFVPSGDDDVFQAAYIVRAVTPGRFIHPPALVEDMYRPDRFARTAAGIVEVAAP